MWPYLENRDSVDDQVESLRRVLIQYDCILLKRGQFGHTARDIHREKAM